MGGITILFINFFKTFINNHIFFRLFTSRCFNSMEPARPLDALNKSRDKRILVELKNNKQYIGKLKSFDIHINVVLEDVEERSNGEVTRKLGVVFIRGDTITIISAD